MKARFKGRQEKIIQRDGHRLVFSPGEWSFIPTLGIFYYLKQFPSDFDVVCEFDIEPFKKAGLQFSFKGRTVSTNHKPTIRYFDKLSILKRSAYLPEKGIQHYRIKTHSDTYLGGYASIQSQVRVLCYRTKGGIGDILMTTPVVEAIAKKYPHYVIDFACPEKYMPLLENNPFVNKVLDVEKIEEDAYEVLYDMTRACIQYEGRTQPNVDLNRTEIFGKIGGLDPHDIPRVKLFLTTSEVRAGLGMDLKRSAEFQRLISYDNEEGERTNQHLLIGLCFESSAPVRSYPHGEALLVELFKEYPGATVLLFSKEPLEIEFEHPRLFKLVDFSFRDIAAILNRCDVFIGPDTGLCHISSSLRTPTVWLFTHINGEVRTRGYDTSIVAQVLPPACGLPSPCWYGFSCDPTGEQRENGISPPCAVSITPMIVMAHVRRTLSTPNISFLVVGHNQFDMSRDCINRLLEVKKYTDEIIFIDNGSTDDTTRYFSHLAADPYAFGFRYFREKENTGCVLARNKALSKASGRFVWFLDNDQFIKYYSLDRIKMVEGDLVGVEGWWINERGFAKPYHRTGMINYVGAGGMFAKRRDLERLGGFDPKYSPAWFEDPDICFKAREAGMTLGLSTDANIDHIAHSTNHSQTDFSSPKVWKRNRKYFTQKWAHLNSSPSVSVLILTHNDSEITMRCIDRIYRETDINDIEIIVVDNGSNEKEKALLAEYKEKPHLRIHFSEENLMVAKGRNLAASMARGDNLLFLDNDMIVPKGWLQGLLLTLDENNVVATSPTVVDVLPEKTQTRFIATVIEDGAIKEIRENSGPMDSDFLPGGAMLVRRALFEKFNFDEKFVFGVEDYDWCLRVKRAGYKFRTSPDITFVHAKKTRERTITKYDDEERKRKGSSFIEDSIRLFLFRWGEVLPNQYKEPGWFSWAIGKDKEITGNMIVDVYRIVEDEVAKRYPEERRVA